MDQTPWQRSVLPFHIILLTLDWIGIQTLRRTHQFKTSTAKKKKQNKKRTRIEKLKQQQMEHQQKQQIQPIKQQAPQTKIGYLTFGEMKLLCQMTNILMLTFWAICILTKR